MKDDELLELYAQRYNAVLRPIALMLQDNLIGDLKDVSHIDRIAARAKSPDRFVEKALKLIDGKPKYDDPLNQIQDQIGARVTVLYKDDVEPATRAVLRYFTSIEERLHVPEKQWEFGYFGMHLVLALPGDAVPKHIALGDAPKFFELQVKTLFQHAWSEANHDLEYKGTVDLSPEQIRRLALTSALAWGADREFSELYKELRGAAIEN